MSRRLLARIVLTVTSGLVFALLVGAAWVVVLLASIQCIGPCAPGTDHTNVPVLVIASLFTVGALAAEAGVVARIWRSA
jgi:hypothetical protein